ncbi:hypothetical protein HETIRDRAFT_118475 [Heterobasidion irregulare TC 32-1]|uniref:Uncharacterized protein n=1 Tax=Heterobasidion irregulare (strain TC 32-1) TaxID=747525 RepID=W4JWU6_HETIT|nr:uncharacterized protein HETIRDRAFT_118475 [Heterobasidion irregulare TC 32-1]ETW77336.1 hypothetical protein HETIRDRAFT_118475 [Heterobasidion irregulare TC 32-1]
MHLQEYETRLICGERGAIDELLDRSLWCSCDELKGKHPYKYLASSSSALHSPPATSSPQHEGNFSYGDMSSCALEMSCYGAPAQMMWSPLTWPLSPSQMPIACGLSDVYDLGTPSLTPMDPQNVVSNTHVPVVIDSPVFTGTFYDTSLMDIVGNATHNPTGQFTPDPVSETAESMSFGFANFADHDLVTSSQFTLPTSKHHDDDGPDERPSTKQPRYESATEFPTRKGYRAPPDPLMDLVPTITAIPDGRQLMNKTLKNTINVYETVVLEKFHREQQSLATIPSENPGPDIQRCPARPAKHVSNAKAGQKPKGASKGRSAKRATASRKSAACTWIVGIATDDKKCPK